jgi:hypothetical protein
MLILLLIIYAFELPRFIRARVNQNEEGPMVEYSMIYITSCSLGNCRLKSEIRIIGSAVTAYLKPSIALRTRRNEPAPHDPLSTSPHSALSIANSLAQSGDLYILSTCVWCGLCKCWLSCSGFSNSSLHRGHSYAAPFHIYCVA